jgi:uroporphyrinogen III methyltransferase / synthase
LRREKEQTEEEAPRGFVSLVGAGPGDPGLLTLKGVEALRQSQVVIYDHLVNERLLEYAPPEAERIYAGKKGGHHALEQEEISALLIGRAKQGKRVVRLKGGDPFTFGRGGEAAQDLVEHGISFEVVPGVSSAVAVPAYAGIPLTHRDYASTVGFITGHEEAGRKSSRVAWSKIATGLDTLVFLMGYAQLPSIAERLIHEGRNPETPAALIRWGTLPRQETIVGTLRDIARRGEEAHFGPPALLVVGEVVRLRSTLGWFEHKPLLGKRIVVTRTRGQASVLSRLLEAQGAEVIPVPVIEILPSPDYRKLDGAIGSIQDYDWIIFTSVHGVQYFWNRLRARGKDARELKGIRLAAIGPATASALRDRGLEPDLVPPEFRAESILDGMKGEILDGKKILLPRAAKARDLLPKELTARGARVTVVEAYRTAQPKVDFERVVEQLDRGEIDVATFTSSSTVHHFMEGSGSRGRKALKKGTVIACIGPITADSAREHGLEVRVQPRAYTIPALVKAICDYFQERKESA